MRSELLVRLRCPITGQCLLQHVIETAPARDGDTSVRTGILWSPEEGFWYPIINHVPVMLVFPTPLAEDFGRRHADVITQLAGGPRMVSLQPEKGERSVQTTFTEEWAGLGDDELSFVYSEEELIALHRDVWLRMPRSECLRVASVLDVGIGFGKEALALSRVFPNARITGVDLNLACIAAGERLVCDLSVNVVVASLFQLPFADAGFDHVHCQGVLHHTRSTEDGFSAIQRQVAPSGSLFVWVYAHEDRHGGSGWKNWPTRIYYWWTHNVFRPVLSRLPAPLRKAAVHIISGFGHPLFKLIVRHRQAWSYRNTLHTVRDAFTPRFAHEHGFNEVLEWFESAGYIAQTHSPATYRNLFGGKRLYGIGVLGRKIETEPATLRPGAAVAPGSEGWVVR